jgi:hypothetical protein
LNILLAEVYIIIVYTSYKAPILIITALSELWKAHWRLMLDNQHLVPAAVFSNTITSLERRKAEDAVLPA